MTSERATFALFATIHSGYTRQRHHQVAEALSTQAEVVWVNPLGVRRPRLADAWRLVRGPHGRRATAESTDATFQSLTVRAVPPGVPFSTTYNRRRSLPHLLRALGSRLRLLWLYYPSPLIEDIVRAYPKVPVVYDCVTNFQALHGLPRNFRAREKWLLWRSDLVLADSTYLTVKCAERRTDVITLPPSVSASLFRFRHTPPPPTKMKRIVFCGSLRRIHFDTRLVRAIAEGFPEHQVDLYGPVDPDVAVRLVRLPNVKMHGMIAFDRVPEVLFDAHVAILPYLLNEFTRGVFPAKTFESLAVGVPTVATPLPDLVQFGSVLHLCATTADFLDALRDALVDEAPERRRARRDVAEQHSEVRFKERIRELTSRLVGA